MVVEKQKKISSKKMSREKAIPKEVIAHLMKDYNSAEDLFGPDGLVKQLTKSLIEAAMKAELSHELGFEVNQPAPQAQTNRRNGSTTKSIRTDHGEIEIDVPRDRDGVYEPIIVPKHQRHFNGFDDKILSLYSLGMTVRDIQSHVKDIYGVEISPDLVSRVTDSIHGEILEWRERPLEEIYYITYIDAIMVNTRENGVVQKRATYIAVGVNESGEKDVLGIWVQATEGAKFWLQIFNELKKRGVKDILIMCADGLTGIGQAIEAAFPKTIFQTCIVHIIRNSLRFVSYKHRKELCADLKNIYTAQDSGAAENELTAFEQKWHKYYPSIAPMWRERWHEITPFLSFCPEIRKIIYTTNIIEGLNQILRKALKTRGHLPDDNATIKLIYLSIKRAKKTWGKKSRDWASCRAHFAIHFAERLTL